MNTSTLFQKVNAKTYPLDINARIELRAIKNALRVSFDTNNKLCHSSNKCRRYAGLQSGNSLRFVGLAFH